ncbi:hypothetical protein [Helicobacter sp. 16-1353]|nr:hypothetical protein [Helicobacter sp. 16-1353]
MVESVESFVDSVWFANLYILDSHLDSPKFGNLANLDSILHLLLL